MNSPTMNKLTTKEWMDTYPDDVKEITYEKLNELYEDKEQISKDIVSLTKKMYLEKENDRWCIKLSIEHDEERLQEIERSIKKFRWMQSYLTNKEHEITDDDIDLARQTPMDSLIPDLKPYGSGKKCARCPFHAEKTASFVVFDNNRFTCFGCNESGSPIDYVMKKEGLTFIEAVKSLINK